MRIDPASVSTVRRSATSWGPAADAPTFLTVAPSPTRAKRGSTGDTGPGQGSVSTSSTNARKVSKVETVPLAPPYAPLAPPYAQLEGGGASFDPLALPLPPEIAPSIYDAMRRLALQAELAGADRLLRDALAELTSALSIAIIYCGPDGLYSLGSTDEVPKEPMPIIAVAKARRAIVGTHSALVPICTASDTIAVIQLARNPRQQAFELVDHVTLAAFARESAAITHHLVVQHEQRRVEAEQDKKGLYRPEAVESHRRRGHEGQLTELSPRWVRRAYPLLVIAVLAAAAFAYVIQVPTYSSGQGVVIYDGTPITAPAPGTVEKVHAEPGTSVRKGEALLQLKADKEASDYAQARTELEAAQQQYLIDSSDETLRKTLISAQATAKRAKDALDQKTVRASADGTVSDIRIRVGQPLELGAPILTIVAPGTEPMIWAYLPGSDRPRIRPGKTLQVELVGYQKTREQATIVEVGRSAIGAGAVRISLGPEVADSLKLPPDGGSYVLVKAKLPRRTFRAKGREYRYAPGMPAKTEVTIESKRFIVTLLPSLEKYVP